MELGTLTLQRFNGVEIFALAEATVRARSDGDVVVLHLYVNTRRPPVKTLPDTADLNAWPNAEVTIRVPRSQAGSLVGRKFSVPTSWDEAEGDHVSCIYYCEHEDLNQNEVEFIEAGSGTLRIRWTGTTTDVNYYDGSKPDTRILIESWFALVGPGPQADA